VVGALRSGMLWLLLTVIAGLVLAANKHWHFIPLSPFALAFGHAHMGGIGALLLLLVAVTLQLLPQHPAGTPPQAAWIVRGINLSLPLLVTSIFLNWPIGKMVAGIGVGVALFLFGMEVTSRCRRMRADAVAPAGLLVSLALWIPAAGVGFALLLWQQPSPQLP